MRICVPTDDEKKFHSHVSRQLEGARFLTVVDTETDSAIAVFNEQPGNDRLPGNHVKRLKGLNVDAIACQQIDARMFHDLQETGIGVLLTESATVFDVAQAVASGELKPLAVARAHGWYRHVTRRRSRARDRAQRRSRRQTRLSHGRWT